MGSSAATVVAAMSVLPDLLLLRPRSAALPSPLPPFSLPLSTSSPSPAAFSPSSSSSSSTVAAAAAAFAVWKLLATRGSRTGSRLLSISWRGGSLSSPSPSPFPLVSAAAVGRGSRNAALCSRGVRVSSPWFQTRSGTHRTFATMSSELPESPANNPGLHDGAPDEATKGYFLQQTMYRIKDPKVSLDFYTRILGMSLLKKFDFPEAKFSLFFLGYEDPSAAPTDPKERTAWTFEKKATLELTHNWGTESDENFKGHHNGNSEPKGYGHIGVAVDDTYKACERFEKLGVKFVKKPDDGRMKGIAFIQDPDGYWIELFDTKSMKSIS